MKLITLLTYPQQASKQPAIYQIFSSSSPSFERTQFVTPRGLQLPIGFKTQKRERRAGRGRYPLLSLTSGLPGWKYTVGQNNMSKKSELLQNEYFTIITIISGFTLLYIVSLWQIWDSIEGGKGAVFLWDCIMQKKTFKILLLLAQEKILLDNPFYQLQKALWHNGAQRIGLTCFMLYWKLMCVLIWQKMFEFSSRKENTILKETSKSIKLEALWSLFSARSKKYFLKK